MSEFALKIDQCSENDLILFFKRLVKRTLEEAK